MTKFRSLIFREFKVSQKLYIISFAVLFAFYVFAIGGAFLFTNLFGELPEKENYMKSFSEMFCMLIMLYSTAVFGIDDNAFKSDLNSGWHNYSYVLPLSAAERAAVKFIRFIGTLCISMLLGIVCVIIINTITGEQFQIGYVILQFIFLDLLLLLKIIIDFFVLRARNTDEYKKMQNKGGLTSLASIICIVLVILKCVGFDFMTLFNSDSNEPLSFGIISLLTGEMLLWIIPLTLVLIAVYFAVVRHHLQYAYPGGAKVIKAKVKAVKAVNLTVPHSEPVGFLYKELRQNTKSISAVIMLPFLILVFLTACIAIVSLNQKDGGGDWILRTLTSDAIRIASIAIGFFSVSGLLMSVFHGDDKKLWAYFTTSAPMGVKKFLYTKYVMSFAMCGLYFVSSYIAETLVATISWFALGLELISFTGISVLIFFMLILQNSFSIPMTIRFGEKKGNIINIIIILCIAIAAVLVLSFIPRDIQDKVFAWLAGFLTGDHGDLTMLLLGIFPAFSVGTYILSYKVSCKIFMKGVNEYDK
ncbi:MAG: ABC-2 transporter permease [Oscillospiraceae bacterium]